VAQADFQTKPVRDELEPRERLHCEGVGSHIAHVEGDRARMWRSHLEAKTASRHEIHRRPAADEFSSGR
jgi:hypothetical protein